MVVSVSVREERGEGRGGTGAGGTGRTLQRSALDEAIWGAYASSSGIRQKRSCSCAPAASSAAQSVSEFVKTPVKTSPRAMSIALRDRE